MGNTRSGLGSVTTPDDPALKIQAGDDYQTIIRKKAIARFQKIQ